MDRPAVTIVLPFHGGAAEADAIAGRLERIALRPGDEVLVVDNNDVPVFRERGALTAVECPVKRSAYAARNVGAERAASEWVLFVDGDCVFPEDLLDRYFDPPPPARAGAVAGQVTGAPGQAGFIPAYMRSRKHLDQAILREHLFRPMAVTANLLVRKDAWESVGGLAEQTLSGADADFCWRLQDAGWTLELRERALVEHIHRDSLRALLVKSARDGAGSRWLSRRWDQVAPHPPLLRDLVRGPGGALVWALRGRLDRAGWKLVDLLFVLAAAYGSLRSNATPSSPAGPAPGAAVLFAAEFPAPGHPHGWFVEADRRPWRAEWRTGRMVAARFAEDEGPLVRALALTRLAARRPAGLVRARRAGGWRALAAAAPAALRLARARRGLGGVVADPACERRAAVAGALAGVRVTVRR